MLIIKSSQHLRTMRQVKSFRSGGTNTGLPMWRAELGRIYQEEVVLANRELHRLWLGEEWRRHLRDCRLQGAMV
ncbi:MAG: hypothetical protein WC443_07710 [Desulfobaccales bacterium]